MCQSDCSCKKPCKTCNCAKKKNKDKGKLIMSTFYEQVYEGEMEERQIGDGVFDITNIEYLFFDSCDIEKENNNKIIKAFQEKHPNWCYANPYETYGFVILSKIPSKLVKNIIGMGFNYGSCNIIENCPSAILITAEND